MARVAASVRSDVPRLPCPRPPRDFFADGGRVCKDTLYNALDQVKLLFWTLPVSKMIGAKTSRSTRTQDNQAHNGANHLILWVLLAAHDAQTRPPPAASSSQSRAAHGCSSVASCAVAARRAAHGNGPAAAAFDVEDTTGVPHSSRYSTGRRPASKTRRQTEFLGSRRPDDLHHRWRRATQIALPKTRTVTRYTGSLRSRRAAVAAGFRAQYRVPYAPVR